MMIIARVVKGETMSEYIYEIIKDFDGIDCYIKRGEIVRCKECKRFYFHKGLKCYFCRRCNFETNENDYCSYGERRDDG